MKKPLVILTGPTAVGKTALSISLAKKINGEIISADSIQVYRGLDIGSAKVTPDEMQGVPHYLIDVLDPKESFDIVLFQQMAKKAMEEIYHKNKIPIIVGGTGFYIQSVLYDIDFSEHDGENELRKNLEEKAQSEEGRRALHEYLMQIDPVSAEKIHENNAKRMIRAIEFFEETGKKISEHNEEQHEKESPYQFCYFVLNDDRAYVYDRIEKRVDLMLENGLIDEVKGLLNKGLTRDLVSMQGLGYKEMIDYLSGACTFEDAVHILKRDTRHFAKRQLTWFKREKEVTWVQKDEFDRDEDQILSYMLSCLKYKNII